jgi:hypothetical protein
MLMMGPLTRLQTLPSHKTDCGRKCAIPQVSPAQPRINTDLVASVPSIPRNASGLEQLKEEATA